MGLLDGKVAFVSGGGKGIGAAVARRFCSEGAGVGFTFLGSEKLARQLEDELGGKAKAFKCDVRDYGQVKNAVEGTVKKFDGLDVVVCNAGAWKPINELEVDERHWRDSLGVNLLGVYHCIRAAASHLKAGGRIINVASTVAFKGTDVDLAYACAKAGVVVMTKQLSKSFGRKGITVNAVAPGPIDTDFLKLVATPERVEKWKKEIPLGRMGRPEDVAAVIAFLASEDAGFVNGQTILVDGGRT